MPSGVIAFTVSGQRERYLRESLGSWGKARGLRDWHLLFSLEPCRKTFPVGDFTQWAHRVFGSAEVVVSDTPLGCLRNTRRAMELAFGRGAEFAILAEEDVLVSDDVLEYMTWARDSYAADGEIVTVCGHAKSAARGGDHEVVRTGWFNPVIWGTWKDRWESFIKPGWGGFEGNDQAWDHNLRMQIHDAGRCSLYPVRSRSFHIGQISTNHSGQLAEFFYPASVSETFGAHREPQDYAEIPFTRKLGLLV